MSGSKEVTSVDHNFILTKITSSIDSSPLVKKFVDEYVTVDVVYDTMFSKFIKDNTDLISDPNKLLVLINFVNFLKEIPYSDVMQVISGIKGVPNITGTSVNIDNMKFFSKPENVKQFLDGVNLQEQRVRRIKLDSPIILHPLLNDKDTEEVWMAGSKPLESFVRLLGAYLKTKLTYDIKASDTDIFFLNSDKDCRMQFDKVDIIKSTKKNVEDLITSFDLPPCQIAINCKDEVVLTDHCLYAILTGRYYIHYKLDQVCSLFNPSGSEQVSDPTFESVLTFVKETLGSSAGHVTDNVIRTKLKKLAYRIMKYKSRGFQSIPVNFIPTKLISVLALSYYTHNPYHLT